MEAWISICGFLENRESKKGKGLTLIEDRTCVQDKSDQRGPILFEDSSLEIQDKNIPKRTYLMNIWMDFVLGRGSAVSHVKPPSIMLSNEFELVKLGLSESVCYIVDAYSWLINLTLFMRTFQSTILVLIRQL